MLNNISYIDTIAVYIPDYTLSKKPVKWRVESPVSKYHTSKGYSTHWVYFDTNAKVWVIYYPQGKMLFVTFSIPRFINNNNFYHWDNFNINQLQDKLYYNVLEKAGININTLPPLIDWQVSRADFFIHHIVGVGTVSDYIKAYSKIRLNHYNYKGYKTTVYLSTKNRNGTTIRTYDKLEEINAKNQLEVYPIEIHDYFEQCSEVDDQTNRTPGKEVVRIEVSMKRRKLRDLFKGKQVYLADIIASSWQESVINKYITRMHLDKVILSKDNFSSFINDSYKGNETSKSQLKEIARLVYDKRDPMNIPSFKGVPDAKRKVKYRLLVNKLYKLGVHIVKSDKHNLTPVSKL